MDLNHRPLPYQGSALTELSYRPRYVPQKDTSTARPLPIASGRGLRTFAEDLLLFGQGHLDATDQVGGEVVHVGGQRRQRGDHHGVDQREIVAMPMTRGREKNATTSKPDEFELPPETSVIVLPTVRRRP